MIFSKGTGTISRSNPFLLFHHAVKRTAQTSLILDNYKLVKTWKDDRLELFDLSESVSEDDDLAETFGEKTEELHKLMVDFLIDAGAETKKTTTKKSKKSRQIQVVK